MINAAWVVLLLYVLLPVSASGFAGSSGAKKPRPDMEIFNECISEQGDPNMSCVSLHRDVLERVVAGHERSCISPELVKVSATYALFNLYKSEGKKDDAQRVLAKNQVYVAAGKRLDQDWQNMCDGCHGYAADGSTMEMEAAVAKDLAEFFSGLGPDFLVDKNSCTDQAVGITKMIRGQSRQRTFNNLAQAIGDAAALYSSTRGVPTVQSAPTSSQRPASQPEPTFQNAPSPNFVNSLPQCGVTKYKDQELYIENLCAQSVTVTWTSQGSVWGAVQNLTTDGSSDTGQTAQTVQAAGGIHLFTCPANSEPETASGQPLPRNYLGPYRCRKN